MTNISKTTPTFGKTKPIVFFGTEDFSAVALTALLTSEFSVIAVVTKPDSKSGRGQKVTESAVKIIAREHNLIIMQPLKLAEITDDLKRLGDVAGVLVSYGKIIPQSIIDIFSPGIINLHPSLLPKYRGPSPMEAAILNGDSVTGVSIMQLSAGMDAGPVYSQIQYQLTGSETIHDLYDELGSLGTDVLCKTLTAILDGSLQPVNQDDSQASYCKLITKNDGLIDWKLPAEQIERNIRAYLRWPKSNVRIGGIDVLITKCHIINQVLGKPGMVFIDPTSKNLIVQAQDNCIAIDTLKPTGKNEMTIAAFLAGYGNRLVFEE